MSRGKSWFSSAFYFFFVRALLVCFCICVAQTTNKKREVPHERLQTRIQNERLQRKDSKQTDFGYKCKAKIYEWNITNERPWRKYPKQRIPIEGPEWKTPDVGCHARIPSERSKAKVRRQQSHRNDLRPNISKDSVGVLADLVEDRWRSLPTRRGRFQEQSKAYVFGTRGSITL